MQTNQRNNSEAEYEEEVKVVIDPLEKSRNFKKANGYSITSSKLMKKYKCGTFEEYKVIRKKHKKEGNVGPRRPKKPVPVESSNQQRKNF